MSLRIRRGTNSERLTKTFDQGELAWTTDTEKLYVGDGVTLGGKNILQSSAGVGFVFNSTTQALEFTVPALNLTTSLVPDSVTTNHLTTGSSGTTFKVVSTAGIQPGMLIIASSFLSGQTVTVVVDSQTLTISAAPDVAVVNNTAITFRSPNLYFTNSRAGQAVYDAFGRGSSSGITFAYNVGTNAISATVNTGNLLPSQTGNSGKYLTTDGTGGLTWTNPISGNMLLPSEAGNQGKYLKVDNSSLPAWADIVIDRLTVNAYSTVLDSFGNLTTPGDIKIPAGKDIKRDNGSGTYVSITGGLGSVSADTSPSLGGNLSLATRSITGTGSIGITGNIVNTGNAQFTGTIQATAGLGANLPLNSFGITGSGSIGITGNITNTGNIVTTGNITGTGNIDRSGNAVFSGTVKAVNGLGGDLSLNSYKISGIGDVIITGSADFSGTIKAQTGLGANLPLNSFGITGTGNINIAGNIAAGAGTISGATVTTPELSGKVISLVPDVNNGKAGLSILTTNNDNDDYDLFTITALHTGGAGNYGNSSRYIRGRGTIATPSAVQTGDFIHQLTFNAVTSASTVVKNAEITVEVDSGTISATQAPAKMSFKTMTNAGSLATALTIDSGSVIGFASTQQLVAGAGSGQVNVGGGVVAYVRLKVGNTTYAMPLYNINP
jgi:hypothetical protein